MRSDVRQDLPLLPERAQLIMRFPLDPPYTSDDIPQLDALHDAIGLGDIWRTSQKRYELFLGVHHSHDMIETPSGSDCGNCWGCTCHSVHILKEPCKGLDLTREKDK